MARRSLGRRLLLGLLPVVILAAGIVGMAALIATKPKLAAVPVEEKVWTVQAAEASPGPVQPDMVFYGQVRAGREVELRPLVPGRIVEVSPNYRDGAFVEAGALLVAIDPFEYEAALAEARAELAEAKARAAELETDLETEKAMLEREQAQRDLRKRDAERYADLRQRGAASGKAQDDAELAYLAAVEAVIQREFSIKKWQATYDRQRAVVERLEVRVRRAERDLADTKSVAPFSGFLAETGVELGKQVTQNDRIARIIDPARMEVRFHVGTARLGELAEGGDLIGRPVEVLWQVQGAPQRYTGTIARIGPEIDAASGGVELYAELTLDERQYLLRPGAFVEVRMKGPRYDNVLRLPESAWQNGFVYAIDGGRLTAREAALVRRLGEEVLVRGAFAAGEQILVTPIPAVETGMRVRIAGGGS